MPRAKRSFATSSTALCCVLVGAASCGAQSTAPSANLVETPDPSSTDGYLWMLPRGFPLPRTPQDNPMSSAKVELGRYLFYEKRLSVTGSYSCASCHEQSKAFTDGRARALGATNQLHPRGAMSLANMAYGSTFTWASSLMSSLEKQALVPMFGETPVELGLSGREGPILQALGSDATYRQLLESAYPQAKMLSLAHVVQALSSFERTLISGQSRYDLWATGADRRALNDSEQRGLKLFFGERAECFHCHGGFNFGDNVNHAGTKVREQNFHNNGLYNVGGTGAYPSDNPGLMGVTGREQDMGRFKAPSLRNVAVTAPYMHDGSMDTLRAVVDHYARGGTRTASGPNAGDGATSPLRSELVHGFAATDAERDDLVHFLESLTDELFLQNPVYADPWPSHSK